MIAIFGASVTQQKNGFATKLDAYCNLPVRIFGYGGMYLNNGAICFIDDVIKEKPSYCFVDWFSTAYFRTNNKTIEYIDTILNKLGQINCIPIFLFLPFKGHPAKRKFHDFCKSVLNDRKVFFIDVYSEIGNYDRNYDIDKILRDNVHTTEYGSNLYSKIIYEKFMENKKNLMVPKNVPETRYTNIKKIKVNREFKKFLMLGGNCEVIGFLLTIGPHSGLVTVEGNESETYMKNTWDRHCHYTRKNLNLSMQISGRTRINILQDHFDTSSCKNPMNFNRQRKKLIVHDIFFVGNDLFVENINDGSRIKNYRGVIINILGRIHQYKEKMTGKKLREITGKQNETQ